MQKKIEQRAKDIPVMLHLASKGNRGALNKFQLSDHFTLGEMLKSDVASRRNIESQWTPDKEVVKRLMELCAYTLEPLRAQFNTPVVPTSGYRCRELNDLVHGSPHSQHMLGMAADIHMPGVDLKEVALAVVNYTDYDQCIFEFGAWIHVSYNRGQCRRQTLIIDHTGTREWNIK